MFAKYHYLSHAHNDAATVHVLFVNGAIAGFLSVLHFPHPAVKNMKKVQRLVILPDYQGVGLGKFLLNKVAERYKLERYRFTITTSNGKLIRSLSNDANWLVINQGRMINKSKTGIKKIGTSGVNRIIASFERR